MERPQTIPGRARVLGRRSLPPLLVAAGATLLAAGILSYGAGSDATGPGGPTGPGNVGAGTRTAIASAPSSQGATASAPGSPGRSSAAPSEPSALPSIPGPAPSEGSPSAHPSPETAAVATRIVMASEGIDLPVISRDQRVSGQGPDLYPPCDVALYHSAFQQPGEPGTTYLYAHAREGMFLPLLTASERHDGASLIGDLVQVYTDDDQVHVYQVTLVKRHATDFGLVDQLPAGESQLILQTSEGPAGTVPKLQVVAAPLDVLPATDREAHPPAHPRACYDAP